MKYIKFLVVLGAVLCMVSCGTQPQTDNDTEQAPKENNSAISTPVAKKADVKTPFEWNFDLLWEVYLSETTRQEYGYTNLSDENVAQWVRKKAEKDYRRQVQKNTLRVAVDDLVCESTTEIACFKYQGEDKLYVFRWFEEGCGGGCLTYVHSLSYDMKTKSFTEIAHPFMPLESSDFIDGLLLVDLPEPDPEEWDYEDQKRMFTIDAEDIDCKFDYDFGSGVADLLLRLDDWYCPNEFVSRGNWLAFDWNGKTFVRKPEADVPGASFDTYHGFYSLKFGSEIPESIEGFAIEPKQHDKAGSKWMEYDVIKDGKVVLGIVPKYDYDEMEYTNEVEIIDIHSPLYYSSEGLHVGSPVADVLGAFFDRTEMKLTAGGAIVITFEGAQFFVDKSDFVGELPEVTNPAGATIDNGSFKPDARVTMIRLFRQS